MRPAGVARNYAEALFALGDRSGRLEEYAGLLDAVAAAVSESEVVASVLASPRVPKATKGRLVGAALRDAPEEFARFVQAVVRRGRQDWLGDIAREFGALVDSRFNRVRASVLVAREPSDETRRLIHDRLEAAFKKQVLETYLVVPSVLGGAVVKVGDRVYDGSVRRSLTRLRRQLLAR
ncbi:MAG: ATP synthase F1 subunit delta [Gemmatimonadales bacterium]|nr:ATP synthase F1 subunit delta [Gemmatimonadales bacterium]